MITTDQFLAEITFSTARSSGPGGQNANKVESKVYLRFDVKNSKILSEAQKELLSLNLSTRINKTGTIVVSSQVGRSQLENKELAIKRLDVLIKKALVLQKKRKKSKPSKKAIEKRLKQKKAVKEKKERRRNL